MDTPHTKRKKISSLTFAATVFLFVLLGILARHGNVSAAALPKPVKDPMGIEANTGEQTQIEIWKLTKVERENRLLDALRLAYRKALNYFLKTFAIDIATYLASGGEGQKPLFYTEGWGAYLSRTANNAAGHFINTFARGLGSENICNLSFKTKFAITLGLKQAVRPEKPQCTFTEMLKNWERDVSDPKRFLEGMDAYFSPYQNDLGASFQVHTSLTRKIERDTDELTKEREEGEGLKSLKDEIAGYIKTPVKTIAGVQDVALNDLSASEKQFLGSIAADTIDTFVTTLAGKFLQRMFQKGLALKSSVGKEDRFNWNDIDAVLSPEASPLRGSQDEARAEFTAFISPRVSIGNPTANRLDVTTELLNDSVINSRFKTAIDRNFTVEKAIQDGLIQLNGAGSTFAFTSLNKQPNPSEGFSYDSMVILRKHRILPVGWELAAAYIQKNFKDRVFSLGDIIKEYDNPSSPFYHLIDTKWVLKSPDAYCRLEGPGEELNLSDWSTEKIIDESRTPAKEYEFNRHTVSRLDSCADSKSCIYEDGNGNCLYYGYCTEERPLWRFNGQNCLAEENSCQKFVNEENDSFSFLADTLNTQDCSVDTEGCQWYCSEYNRRDNFWTCLVENERVIKPCDNPNGCPVVDSKTGETCTIPFEGVNCAVPSCRRENNLVPNPGFERGGATPRAPDGWETFGKNQVIERVSGTSEKIYFGNYSLKMSYFGGLESRFVARSSPLVLTPDGAGNPAVAYTLTARVYNALTYGRAYAAVVNEDGKFVEGVNTCKTNPDMEKGRWNAVNCTFNLPSGVPQTIYAGLILEDNNYPVGSVWFDEIDIQPACPSRDVVVFMNAEDSADESKIFFDKEVRECSADDAGCHEFIRTKSGLGTNMVINGSFEDWSDGASAPRGWIEAIPQALKISENPAHGGNFLRLTQNGSLIFPSPFPFESDKTYILSLYGKKSPNNANPILTVEMDYIFGNNAARSSASISFPTMNFSDGWKRFVSSPFRPPLGRDFRILFKEGAAGEVDIDAVMMEEATPGVVSASPYAEYGSKNNVYLKKPPEYLECAGNPETDHTRCQNYALQCSRDEVGCELFSPLNGDPPVPGIITEFDQCPSACVGYDAFKQSATNFEQEKFPAYYLIPKTGKKCQSSQVGCAEFTNLDEVKRGGEGIEYYKYLRQCVKPNNACKTFYTWVGSDVSGYQLKVYSLRDADENKSPDQIPNPRQDLGACSNAQDGATNPNCREFYSADDQALEAKYVILQNTISCTDSCVPYRLNGSEKNDCEQSGGAWGVCKGTAGADISDAGGCSRLGGFVMPGTGECWTREFKDDAKNLAGCDTAIPGLNTTFDARNQCVYLAVPQEGEKCSAQNASCREYRGNSSANVRVAFSDNFEASAPARWGLGEISNDALAVGGHSLKTESSGGKEVIETFSYKLAGNRVCAPLTSSDPAIPNNPNGLGKCDAANSVNCWDGTTRTCPLGDSSAQKCTAKFGANACGVIDSFLVPGVSYLVSFWAKSASGQSANIDISLSTRATTLDTVTAKQDWQEFIMGPFELLETEAKPGASLKFSSDKTAYYDYVTIKITSEYQYLIKNSWQTPTACDTNPYVTPPAFAPQFMLGCQEYRSLAGKKLTLKSFDRLCRESAVGCEALIDTQNTNSPFSETFQEQNPQSRVDIPDDSFAYFVNSPDKACGKTAKGCEAYGAPEFSQDGSSVASYATKYLINDPEKYGSILCNESNVGCARYVSEQEGIVYMKDPKSRTCEYKQIPGSSSYGWFQAGTKSGFPDCPTALNRLGIEQPGKSCLGGDVSGAPCATDGECLGGGRCVGRAGMCSGEKAGCTAYVDPQSTINTNILTNGNFEGYYKVCSKSKSPCNTLDQCPSGEACGPETRISQWVISSSSAVKHSRFTGYGSSSAVEFAGADSAVSISQGKTLTKGVLYTISARAKETSIDAQLKINTSIKHALKHFDNSLQIDSDGNTVTLPVANETGQYKIFAGRFFVADQDADVSVILSSTSGKFDDVEVKNTGVYYYLSNDVDKRSCNATVNPELGCVLFNDTSVDVLSFTSLESKPGSPAEVCKVSGCDSNAVIKVTPDRDCGKWLECVSGREQLNTKTGKKEVFCQQIAECSSLNPVNGQCNSFPPPVQEAQEFGPENVDFIKNITGYSKVGFKWDENSSVEGYFPYGAMEQKKVCVEPAEKSGELCIEDEDCQTAPGKGDGVCQPILKVRDDKDIYQSCRVYPESGSPRWSDQGPNDTGDKPSANVVVDINNPLGKKNWKNIDSLNQKILAGASECSYKKDEALFQGIYGFCVEKDPRSPYLCLNWLPVDEITGGWVGVSGWADNVRDSIFYCTEGAALEYRREARESKCYQSDFWSVKNMLDFGVSIAPKQLVQITPEQLAQLVVEHPQCGKLLCPPGYEGTISTKKCGSFFRPGQRCDWTCVPKAEGYKFTDSNNIAWYDYIDKMDKDKNFIKKHLMYCPGCKTEGKVIYDPEEPKENEPRGWLRICDALTKVTDDDGDNKAWKQRVEAIREFDDSGYRVPDYNYTIDIFTRPFGSLGKQWKGDPASWPYLADTLDPLKYERPYFDYFEGGENTGNIYHDVFSKINPVPFNTNPRGGRERVKRLFAQNFGTWQWNGANYQKLNATDSRCVGGPSDSASCNLADANGCKDGGKSTCVANPGYCEYYSLTDPKLRNADDKISCTDAPGGASAQCDNLVFCATKFCRTGSVDTSTFKPCSDTNQCSGGEECKPPEDKLGYCSDDTTQSCTEDSQCQSRSCVFGAGVGYCSAGILAGQACGGGSGNATCNVANTLSRCVGRCSSASAVSGEVCRTNLECQVDGVCTDFSYWVPPKNSLCPLNIRPNYFTENPDDPADPLAPGDWCGVAPEIYNFAIQGALRTPFEIYGGSGEITFTFNIKVDNNQLPLKEFIVDWGDSQPQTLTAPRFGIKDKPDVKDPFVFPHIYTYDKAYDEGCARDPNNPESCDGYSDYKIHVLAKDNWGWCSCKNFDTCKPASSVDGDCENQLSDRDPSWQELDTSNSWIAVPVIIRVYSTAQAG